MSRLSAMLKLDVQLQARHKVYLIVAVAVLAVAAALNALFPATQLRFFMPVIVLGSVSVTTVFLVGVLVLLERGEGMLDVVLVSPLRPSEYLASKVISLAMLALAESAIFAVVAYGLGFSAGWFVLSIVMRGVTGVAVGIVIGVRYRSITHFLVPAILVSMLFDLPNLWYLEILPSPLFYLWPSMPPLVLAKAAFFPVDPGQIVYAFVYGLLVVWVALFAASRAIDRYVVRGEVSE